MRYIGIIDGSYILHRTLKAGDNAGLATSMGDKTGGVFGALRTLRGTLNAFQFSSLIFVFDSMGYSKRRLALLPSYKESRKSESPSDDDISYFTLYEDQRTKLKAMLTTLGIPYVAVDGHEGDDVVAYLARKAVDHSLVISDDKDYLHIVSEKVHVWRPIKNQHVRLDNFKQCTNLESPAKMLFYMALTGDGGDDIPGIPKCGDVTACQFVDECQKISYAELERVAKKYNTARHLSVLEHYKDIIRNFQLIDLSKEVFTAEDDQKILEMFNHCKWQVDELKFAQLCRRFEFNSISNSLMQWLQPFKFLGRPLLRIDNGK